MAMNQTFTDALMQLRRKAQLTGRPLTRAETAGITMGMAESASDRLARARAAEQGDKALGLQEDQLQLSRMNAEREFDIANKAMRQEKYRNIATSALLGGSLALQNRGAIAGGLSKLGGLISGGGGGGAGTVTRAAGNIGSGVSAAGTYGGYEGAMSAAAKAAPTIWGTIKGIFGF